MTSKKDTRTRAEKLRDLATNPGATDAEKNTALFFLKNSAIGHDNKRSGSGSTITNEPPPSPPDEIKRRKAASQYETARRIQRHINEEIRRRNAPPRTPPKAANTTQTPLSRQPSDVDYSPLFLLALFIILSLYYGC